MPMRCLMEGLVSLATASLKLGISESEMPSSMYSSSHHFCTAMDGESPASMVPALMETCPVTEGWLTDEARGRSLGVADKVAESKPGRARPPRSKLVLWASSRRSAAGSSPSWSRSLLGRTHCLMMLRAVSLLNTPLNPLDRIDRVADGSGDSGDSASSRPGSERADRDEMATSSGGWSSMSSYVSPDSPTALTGVWSWGIPGIARLAGVALSAPSSLDVGRFRSIQGL
mmetsp:Transcript_13005/g.36889  ORF Transcript_13005/g.36889 Transcript_13005/m.36889 type:complete len:229 (+) Transcript_13005:2042-2728(+)